MPCVMRDPEPGKVMMGKMLMRLRPLAGALMIGFVVGACADASADASPMAESAAPEALNTVDTHAGHAAIPAAVLGVTPAAGDVEMTVHLTPTCGCCGGWVDHMREAGYTVTTVYQDDLVEVHRRHGIPSDVVSCHLGVVDGYLVEGHVPADVVTRLLTERPKVAGIAVPGMVTGTPGMEHPSGHMDPYDVVSFDENGVVGVYESRR